MLNLFSYKYLNGVGHHVAPLPSSPGVWSLRFKCGVHGEKKIWDTQMRSFNMMQQQSEIQLWNQRVRFTHREGAAWLGCLAQHSHTVWTVTALYLYPAPLGAFPCNYECLQAATFLTTHSVERTYDTFGEAQKILWVICWWLTELPSFFRVIKHVNRLQQ